MRRIPGRGLPFIRTRLETREFMGGWRSFFERRRDRYQSTVFRTWVGVPAITVIDVDGFQALFDPGQIRKRYGFGPIIPRRDLVGTTPMVFHNDESHRHRKGFLLEFLSRQDASLEGEFLGRVDAAFQRWAGLPTPFDWGAELDSLLTDFFFHWLLGASPSVEDLRTWLLHFRSPLPWDIPLPPAPSEARLARDGILRCIREAPAFKDVAALGMESGGLEEDEVARQLLFSLCFNGWGGLHALLRSLVGELTVQTHLVPMLRKEVHEVSRGSGLDRRSVARMSGVEGLVKETFRLHSPVSSFYGEAKEELFINSSSGRFRVRKGELIQGSFLMASRDPDYFPEPDAVLPERYADLRARRGLLWAGGPGTTPSRTSNKVCPGRDLAPLILELLAARLVSQARWSLDTEPRWSHDRVIRGRIPVEPLRVTEFNLTDFPSGSDGRALTPQP